MKGSLVAAAAVMLFRARARIVGARSVRSVSGLHVPDHDDDELGLVRDCC
jgi:hypothetical protein